MWNWSWILFKIPLTNIVINSVINSLNYCYNFQASVNLFEMRTIFLIGNRKVQFFFQLICFIEKITIELVVQFRKNKKNVMILVGDQARGMMYWVANSQRSSYFMLNVDGHNLYRLNYPLRLNKWYHSCTSWNGRTGEWQIWVNDERVGRGYNNHVS